ncbi:MAG: hypothetical protein ACREPQ_09705 [Rhodanobacter sp.]
MRRTADLEARLTDWANVYGGGRYGISDGLKSPMGSMMKWGGRPPSGLGQDPPTPEADAVQDAVRALERQQHGWLPAQVLRCEYLTPGQPIDSKLQRLRAAGSSVSDRARYAQLLAEGRKHVAAWIRLPYSEEVTRPDTPRHAQGLDL